MSSNSWLLLLAKFSTDYGGAMRDRTADLLRAKQALSQLSYSPIIGNEVVGLSGLEPPTSPLSGVRSNHLSYRPTSCTVSKLESRQSV